MPGRDRERVACPRVKSAQSARDVGALIRPGRSDLGAALAKSRELGIAALVDDVGAALETNDNRPVALRLVATGPIVFHLRLHRPTSALQGERKRLRIDARLVGRPHRERDGGRRFRVEGIRSKGEETLRRPLGGYRRLARGLTERLEGEGGARKPVAAHAPILSSSLAHVQIVIGNL